MKRTPFLLLLLLLAAPAARAQTHSNKSFIILRPPGRALPVEHTTWYHEQRNADNLKNCTMGGTVQMVAFYNRSHDSEDAGKYFGILDHNNFTYANGTTFPYLATEDLIHDNLQTRGALSGEITLKPTREIEGMRISYHKTLKDAYFCRGSLPILRVKHHLHAVIDSEHKIGTTGLLDLLDGSYSHSITLGDGNAQDALLYSKISGLQKGEFGLGDIDLVLGRRLIDEETLDCAIFAKLVLPTSNASTGEFLFEPLRGNGKHWELGGGIETSFDMWSDTNSHIELMLHMNIMYIFSANEKRTFNSNVDIKVVPPWSRYMLVGTSGQKGLKPLANVSTISAKISPGFQSEAMCCVGYRADNISLDVGYNMFAREGENITIKDWTDDRYAFTHATEYSTEASFLSSTDHYLSGIDKSTIKKDELDLVGAATPAGMTHMLFVGVGYLSEDKVPVMGGLGASYEWARENSSMSNYSIWGKVGMAF